jgi:UDP-N-acetylglucosamine 1-carboxyvinyltransferase
MFIDSSGCSFWEAPYELVSKMRASIYVLGPLLARFGKAKVSFPGGCAIGSRPIDLHLMAMKKLNAEITQKSGYVYAETDKLKGAEVYFEKSSVGATANTLMAAVLAKGTTTLLNTAIEPEIDFLVDFLNKMGAKIEGKGTTKLTVTGVNKLHPIDMEMMPDRIEAGTFMLAAAITKGELFVKNAKAEHLHSLINKMEAAGCRIDIKKDGINVKATNNPQSTNIKTLPYPQ